MTKKPEELLELSLKNKFSVGTLKLPINVHSHSTVESIQAVRKQLGFMKNAYDWKVGVYLEFYLI